MTATRPFVLFAVLASAGGLVACQSIESPGPAFVMSPAVPFLSSEVARALRSLQDARGDLTKEQSEVRKALDEAEKTLARLQTYYLPLLEARQRAFNARQLAASGDLGKARSELEHIEATLLTLAGSGGDEMGREVEKPLDLVEDARVALARSSPEAVTRLEALAEHLELMLLKGDLVLD
jgi:chromosome segregation ATPase